MTGCAACGRATCAHPDAIFAGVVPDPISAGVPPFSPVGIAGAAPDPCGAGDHLLDEGARDRDAQLLRSEVKGVSVHNVGQCQ